MNWNELLTELDEAYKPIHKISNAIASNEGITGNPDYGYLSDKIEAFVNTARHVLNQAKSKKKDQRKAIHKK